MNIFGNLNAFGNDTVQIWLLRAKLHVYTYTCLEHNMNVTQKHIETVQTVWLDSVTYK